MIVYDAHMNENHHRYVILLHNIIEHIWWSSAIRYQGAHIICLAWNFSLKIAVYHWSYHYITYHCPCYYMISMSIWSMVWWSGSVALPPPTIIIPYTITIFITIIHLYATATFHYHIPYHVPYHTIPYIGCTANVYTYAYHFYLCRQCMPYTNTCITGRPTIMHYIDTNIDCCNRWRAVVMVVVPRPQQQRHQRIISLWVRVLHVHLYSFLLRISYMHYLCRNWYIHSTIDAWPSWWR